MMGLVNFVRLVTETTEEGAGIVSLEYKREFRRCMVSTIERGLMRRLMQ